MDSNVETAENIVQPETSNQKEILFHTNLGIREYALKRGEKTEELLRGAVLSATNLIKEEISNDPSTEKASTRDLVRKHAPKAVAQVVTDHVSSGLSIPRVFIGGEYELADVIGAVNCIDISVFTREVLKEGFDIEGEVRRTRLGFIPHHYLRLSSGEIIDPIIAKKKQGGYFRDEKSFKRRLNFVNSGGLNLIKKQIKGVLHPKNEKK